jgi:hypothetical protein
VYKEAGQATAIQATSGLMQKIIDGKSFTIAGHFMPQGGSATPDTNYANNMIMACGATDADVTPTPTQDNMCFLVSTSGRNTILPGARFSARFYEDGDPGTELALFAKEVDLWRNVNTHYAVVYDDQTRGVAFYIGGYLQESGTLGESLIGQMRRVVHAGFNMTFMGSIDQTDPLAYVSAGGIDSAGGDIAIFSRPLLANEINYLAQSGININDTLLTTNDPRLRGYWTGVDASQANLFMAPDRARVWENLPGNLIQVQSDAWWDVLYGRVSASVPYADFEMFNQIRPTSSDPLQASFGNLGITSGVWMPIGGNTMQMTLPASTFDEKGSSYGAIPMRYKPHVPERDSVVPHYFNQFILSFEVTPSGEIPDQSVVGDARQFNSRLVYYGNGNTNEDYIVHLEQASGVIQAVLTGRFNSTNTLVAFAPNLPYGIPSRITFWVRADEPYVMNSITGADDARVSVYVDGAHVDERFMSTDRFRITPNSRPFTGDDHQAILQFGGKAISDSPFVQESTGPDDFVGLGEIYMRNIFLMNGYFTATEVVELATNGIQEVTGLSRHTPTPSVTEVNINDPDLKGYYRFTGGEFGRGTDDLSNAENDLTDIAKIWKDGGNFVSSTDNAFDNLRWLPGPFKDE